jgi:hypothetical protein
MPDDPRHCPFCGTFWHDPYLAVVEKDIDPLGMSPDLSGETVWVVTCYQCAFDGPWGHDRQEAIDRWNVRKRSKMWSLLKSMSEK